MSMDQITDTLYLGGLDAACNTEDLKTAGITHILTVDLKPLMKRFSQPFVYKYIFANDVIEGDLLTYFEEALGFMKQGTQNGKVLVHCYHGVSRSATLVIAFLMNQHKISLQDAMKMVKDKREQICPNPGFQAQLELFNDMEGVIDKTNPHYKMYRLNKLALRMQADDYQTELPLTLDPTQSSGNQEEQGTVFKCKKCRRPLFRSSAVLCHVQGPGESAFDWRHKRESTDEKNTAYCSQSLFIEPVQWMGDSIQVLEGKLSCPKCSAKIGSFNWAGERCPCGEWVTPAFHIQKQKVDEMKVKQIPQPVRVGQSVHLVTKHDRFSNNVV